MKHKLFALILALTVVSWAQTATQTTPAAPAENTSTEKAKCACCAGKDGASCCGKDAKSCMKDGKTTTSCCKDGCGKDKMASCCDRKAGNACGEGCCGSKSEKAS